ncbi:unnamed protein product [Linum tenue]|uniref:Lil3 protein n=1 Tax=Linum tenue TaxID=586396 RepID=A0AAV0K8K8_9ROSI|nr:unnamed protein product [Linum tenue]
MSISTTLLSPPPAATARLLFHTPTRPALFLRPTTFLRLSAPRASVENGTGIPASSPAVAVEEPAKAKPEAAAKDSSNGAAASKFVDGRWIGGTWDLKQFKKDGSMETDWDAVIDAEARRRKWLEANPESTSNDDLIVFDTSIIPWWAWVKRYHLPEAELLNGRAAMIGFFMAYFVDSLTGVGLVDQMGNFFCKTLLFVAVVGVLVIRKNEDLETVKKLVEETTFYDKQWQAAWKDENTGSSKKE